MVTDDGRIKLLDFGLATLLASAQSQPSQAGPSVYMSPEQLEDPHRSPNPRSEIFSFGVILHQMISGRHPFHRRRRDEMLAAIRTKHPRPLPPKAPAALADIVHRCLQRNPEDRPASMRDVFVALNHCRLTSPPDSRAGAESAALSSIDVRRVRSIARRIAYDNMSRGRLALAELQQLLPESSPAVRQSVTSALRDVILTIDQEGNGVSPQAREVQRLTLHTLRVSTQGRLAECFKNGELEHLDLYEMDFAGEPLPGISFKGCFLVAASFRQCDLSGASFAGAWIRNVNLAEANLSGVDMTDADWFNALGLTETQLSAVQRETLRVCPGDLPALRSFLEARYGFPFESWSTNIQEQLRSTWAEYVRPGGLQDIVQAGRRKSA